MIVLEYAAIDLMIHPSFTIRARADRIWCTRRYSAGRDRQDDVRVMLAMKRFAVERSLTLAV
jgi:hypothetical protein